MTRRPVYDERIFLPERSVLHKDRVYLRELSAYLGHEHRAIRRFCKKHGYLRRAGRGGSLAPIPYISSYAAIRVIAYFRSIQGAVYVRGKDFHALRDARNAYSRELKRRHRELNAQAVKGLDGRGAEAEAERQRSACAKAESPKPRRCV